MQMITSRRFRFLSMGIGAVLLIALTVVGCDSFLNVEQNPNQPDRQRALANPEDVVSLTSDAFFRYWRAMYLWSPGQGLSNAGHEFRGGFAADDLLGQIPRVPRDNSTTFCDSNHNEFPLNRGYKANP